MNIYSQMTFFIFSSSFTFFFVSHISLAGMKYCGLVFMFDPNLLMLLLRTGLHQIDHILEIKELSEGEVVSSVTTS